MANELLNLGSAAYGTLGWTSDNNNAQILRSGVVTPVIGSMCLAVQNAPDAIGNVDKIIRTPEGINAPRIDSSLPVTFSFSVIYTGSQNIFAQLIWLDETGGEIGRSAETGFDAGISWQRFSITEQPPSECERVSVQLRTNRSQPFYIDAVTLCQTEETDYIPSLRVREDLSIEVHSTLYDKTGPHELVSRSSNAGSKSWSLEIDDNAVTLKRFLDNDNNTSLNLTAPYELQDGVAHVFTFNYKADTGTLTVLVDGNTVANIPSSKFYLNNDASDIRIGRFVNGSVSRVTLRDGISGPVLLDLSGNDLLPSENESELINGLVATRVGDAKTIVGGVYKFNDGSVDVDDMHEVVEWYADGVHYDTLDFIGETPTPTTGNYTWIVGFDRAITGSRRQELEAWDGSLEDEPLWMRRFRPLVVYMNANELLQRSFMSSDDFLNLTESGKYRKRDDDGARSLFYVSSNNRAKFTAGNV